MSETKKSELFGLKNDKFIAKSTKSQRLEYKNCIWNGQRKKHSLLEKSVKKYSKNTKSVYSKILVKNQKNRCESVSKNGTINFNQKL